MLIVFHKPFGVLSQFTDDGSQNRTLSEFHFPGTVYPIGRLDADSEGLLLLSDEKSLVDKLLNPKNAHLRTYYVQVEHIPTEESLATLRKGLRIGNGKDQYTTLPCHAHILQPQPIIPDRNPPIRIRKTIPTCWLAIRLMEGKNRQVRKMTAAIGCPTLRLIRVGIGGYNLDDSINNIPVGHWKICDPAMRQQIFDI
jgi:23S rRNA pseudouridine2457 synthase